MNKPLSTEQMATHHGRPKIDHDMADLLVRCVILLNHNQNIVPRDPRLHFDGRSLSEEITHKLKAAGWNWQILKSELPRE